MSAKRATKPKPPPAYVTTSLQPPARAELNRAAAVLTGKLGRRVSTSEALIALIASADWNAVARRIESGR